VKSDGLPLVRPARDLLAYPPEKPESTKKVER
jgi:hypothetical protein